jgi:hypothetical protein
VGYLLYSQQDHLSVSEKKCWSCPRDGTFVRFGTWSAMIFLEYSTFRQSPFCEDMKIPEYSCWMWFK